MNIGTTRLTSEIITVKSDIKVRKAHAVFGRECFPKWIFRNNLTNGLPIIDNTIEIRINVTIDEKYQTNKAANSIIKETKNQRFFLFIIRVLKFKNTNYSVNLKIDFVYFCS